MRSELSTGLGRVHAVALAGALGLGCGPVPVELTTSSPTPTAATIPPAPPDDEGEITLPAPRPLGRAELSFVTDGATELRFECCDASSTFAQAPSEGQARSEIQGPLRVVHVGEHRVAVPRGARLRFASIDGAEGQGRVLIYDDDLRRCASFDDDLAIHASMRAEVTRSSRTVQGRAFQVAEVRTASAQGAEPAPVWWMACAADGARHLRVELSGGGGLDATELDALLESAARLSTPR